MRRRLVAYFERKGCQAADDLADQTLHRVARRLEEQCTIADAPPAKYCYITAKFVFLENLRKNAAARSSAVDLALASVAGRVPTSVTPSNEMMLERLDCCLRQLAAAERELILEYYQGEQAGKIERRRQLARRLQISSNALSIRASRIRDRLETCVKGCSDRR